MKNYVLSKDTLKSFADLFIISFLALYFEILFIRWIPSTIQIVSYFTNILLISAFLGLGLGCLLSERRMDLFALFPFSVFSMVAVLLGANSLRVKADFIHTEHLLGSYSSQGVNFLLVISIIFIFNTLIFLLLGQKLGNGLKKFKPLVAYSINVAGSICGVLVFSLFSTFLLKPIYWFFFGLFFSLWFTYAAKRQLVLQGLIIMFTVLIVSQINPASHWSPYYRIDISPIVSRSGASLGFSIAANNTFHQNALDLSDKAVSSFPELKIYKDIYEFPYRFIHPRKILVLGAGSGNDYLTALRMGIKNVSAVEIDPLIAGLGLAWHKRGPDGAKEVQLYIDDARSFIKKTNEKFDLITFGYLDSHKVLSQFSSVRIDNFIYTKESFEDVKNHLNPNGIVAVTYFVFKEWVAAKVYATLAEVFGEDLLVFRTSTYNNDDTVIFLAGANIKNSAIPGMPGFKLYDGFDKKAQFITDNWPYLYLFKKSLPVHYVIILAFVFCMALVGLLYVRPYAMSKFDMHFFFLGAGFMLLETVGITRFALLFGSTWVVNSFVIVSILMVVLLANLLAEKIKNISINLMYAFLIVSIFLNWLIKPSAYLVMTKGFGAVVSSLVLSLPLLFAGIIFATSFKKSKDIAGIFAYNLLGAILGGLCEYISMMTGFGFLFILAMLMYGASYLGIKKQNVSLG